VGLGKAEADYIGRMAADHIASVAGDEPPPVGLEAERRRVAAALRKLGDAIFFAFRDDVTYLENRLAKMRGECKSCHHATVHEYPLGCCTQVMCGSWDQPDVDWCLCVKRFDWTLQGTIAWLRFRKVLPSKQEIIDEEIPF